MSRDRIVSLATVLLALAGGVALGGGPLQGGERSTRGGADAAASTLDRSEGVADQARAFDDAYVRSTAPAVLGRRLEGRTVTVVTLPGADPGRVAELSELVGVAGGAVTVQAQVHPALLDVGNRQLVAELARQMHGAARAPVRAPTAARGYDVMGRLIGHALTDRQNSGAPGDRTGESILAGLETAQLLTTTEPVRRRGSLVLVVAGAPDGSEDQRQGAASIVTSLAAGLDASSDGAVLADPATVSPPEGFVGVLRAAPAGEDVSTVDGVRSVAGAVVAVRALAEQARGSVGHYGAQAPDGVLPRS